MIRRCELVVNIGIAAFPRILIAALQYSFLVYWALKLSEQLLPLQALISLLALRSQLQWVVCLEDQSDRLNV